MLRISMQFFAHKKGVSSTKNDANNALKLTTRQAISDEHDFSTVLSGEEERM